MSLGSRISLEINYYCEVQQLWFVPITLSKIVFCARQINVLSIYLSISARLFVTWGYDLRVTMAEQRLTSPSFQDLTWIHHVAKQWQMPVRKPRSPLTKSVLKLWKSKFFQLYAEKSGIVIYRGDNKWVSVSLKTAICDLYIHHTPECLSSE